MLPTLRLIVGSLVAAILFVMVVGGGLVRAPYQSLGDPPEFRPPLAPEAIAERPDGPQSRTAAYARRNDELHRLLDLPVAETIEAAVTSEAASPADTASADGDAAAPVEPVEPVEPPAVTLAESAAVESGATADMAAADPQAEPVGGPVEPASPETPMAEAAPAAQTAEAASDVTGSLGPVLAAVAPTADVTGVKATPKAAARNAQRRRLRQRVLAHRAALALAASRAAPMNDVRANNARYFDQLNHRNTSDTTGRQ